MSRRYLGNNPTMVGTLHPHLALPVAVAAAAAESAVLDVADFALGQLLVPAALDANTVIGFKVAADPADAFLPLKDKAGALVQVPVAVNEADAYALPVEALGSLFIKLWTCTAAGVDVPQAAERVFTLVLKG